LEKRLSAALTQAREEALAAMPAARSPDPAGTGGEDPAQASRSRAPEPENPEPKVPGDGLEQEVAVAWPGEADEAAFLAGEREQFTKAPAAEAAPRAETSELAERGEPPSLEELVQRIPADLRLALDELFRAKFTRATRVRPAEKKAGPG